MISRQISLLRAKCLLSGMSGDWGKRLPSPLTFRVTPLAPSPRQGSAWSYLLLPATQQSKGTRPYNPKNNKNLSSWYFPG